MCFWNASTSNPFFFLAGSARAANLVLFLVLEDGGFWCFPALLGRTWVVFLAESKLTAFFLHVALNGQMKKLRSNEKNTNMSPKSDIFRVFIIFRREFLRLRYF